MSEEIKRCPFCGGNMIYEGSIHYIDECRIRRFNEACDAAISGLLADPTNTEYSDDLIGVAIRKARALVDAIESAAKEKGEE